MQITKIAFIQLYKILKVTKRCMQRLVICSSLVFVVLYKDMRGQYVQITKIRYLCFDLVHSRYTRMPGFGRRKIELMQALCIYNIYIEYYSVIAGLSNSASALKYTHGSYYVTYFVVTQK